MKIVFDMDNTLVDEFGSELRPGIVNLLQKLVDNGHQLILWTSSTRRRALTILDDHRLKSYFQEFLFREDYDPNLEGRPKDIRQVQGDVLIDDDPNQIQFAKSVQKDGFLISPFRKGQNPSKDELVEIYQFVNRPRGILANLKRRLGF